MTPFKDLKKKALKNPKVFFYYWMDRLSTPKKEYISHKRVWKK